MAHTGATVTLGAHTGTGAATAVSLGQTQDLNLSTVYVYGTFVGTVSIEVSPDGTNYTIATTPAGAPITATAPGTYVIAGDATHVRSNCTAYTSGTINVKMIYGSGIGKVP